MLLDKKTVQFTNVYNEYYALVYSVAYSKLRNTDAAKDVSQEVFTRFLQKMDETDNYRRWLLSALKYVILEYIRKNGAADIDIFNLENDINISFINEFSDSRIILEEALNNMEVFGDDRTKTLFDLVALYRYTYKETGKELGMSERQVKYRYRQTVNKLLDYLKTKGIRALGDLV